VDQQLFEIGRSIETWNCGGTFGWNFAHGGSSIATFSEFRRDTRYTLRPLDVVSIESNRFQMPQKMHIPNPESPRR
jgi:hypothetical protein